MQGRRLDGKTYPEWRTLPERKTHNVCGTSARHPVGLPEIGDARVVMLVEGSADLVAAHHVIWLEGRANDTAAVAMLGAGLLIPDQDLKDFAGKRVRIFPHADREGMRACQRWADQLRSVGATVDGFRFRGLRRGDGAPVIDMNDLCKNHRHDFEKHCAVGRLIP